MHLTDFPLFPEELQLIASGAEEATIALEPPGIVGICEGVKQFYKGDFASVFQRVQVEDMLADCFWRQPPADRPSVDGPWQRIATIEEGINFSFDQGRRVVLCEGWHNGDWPPGCSDGIDRGSAAMPSASLCLERVLGWLRAPRDFWDSPISTPCSRFHLAVN